MRLSDLDTGNAHANDIFRFIVSHCESLPGPLGEDYRDGIVSMFFTWQYLALQKQMKISGIVAAVDHLKDTGFIRVDEMMTHGIHVWLRKPVQELVA